MIVLDTNVLSELMRPSPSPNVAAWIASQSVKSVYLTSITQAEILYGIALLPGGKKRRLVEEAAAAMFETEFAGRVLPFESDAAKLYTAIGAERRRIGKPISQFDAQIASIVASVGATLATRNVDDFERCNVDLLNPWD